MISLLIPLLISALTALALTPVVRWLASTSKFVDRPDGYRKVHVGDVALGGGLALFVSLLIGAAVGGWVILPSAQSDSQGWHLGGLLAASILLCTVGLFDDRRSMSGASKLLWQVLASSLVIGSGVVIDRITIFGWTLQLGMFGYMLTMIWLLAAINSINLIDGVDGLAASVGLVFSLSLAVMAVMFGHTANAVVALAMAGGLLGFLPYNLPRAKIYLGDAGSMLIGLVLGSLALQSTFKEAATVAFAAPLALWAIPMFDSSIAIARRLLTGRSVYSTDRGHFHHRLLTRGLTSWQALLIVTALCTVTSGAAVASVYFEREAIGLAVACIVIASLVATRVFGHVELLLLNSRVLGIGRNLVSANDSPADHSSVRLQGTMTWEHLWEALVESAERFGLCRIRMNLFVPRLHEDFYARWDRNGAPAPDKTWQLQVALRLGDATVGQLRVVGEQTGESMTDQLREFLDFVEEIQQQLPQIVDRHQAVEMDVARRPPMDIKETATADTLNDEAVELPAGLNR